MTDSPFRGVIPPVVIPLTEKRQLDLEALERSINRMIEAGVDGLFFLGSSGEVAFLTDAQRYHVLQEAVAMVHGRVPVLAGIIDMETLRVVDQAKRAAGYGVDALVATAPFYALGGPKEVERHSRAIREHTDLPLFAYDLPACVHTKLDPTMLVRLGEDGVLQGVKDSSGDDVSFRWLCLQNEDAGHPLQLLTGHEVVVDGAYLGGADGSVPGLANIDPAARGAVARGAGRRLGARARYPEPPGPPHVRDARGEGHRGLRRRRGRVQDGAVADGRVQHEPDARARVRARGRGRGPHRARAQEGRSHGCRRTHAPVHLERLPRLRLLGIGRPA